MLLGEINIMKIFGHYGLGAILKFLLQVGFGLGLAILVAMPYLLKIINESLNWYWLIVYPTGILFLIIVIVFIKLFDSLKDNNPFNRNNLKLMNIAKYASLGISEFIIVEIILVLTLYRDKNVIFLIFLTILFFGVFIALHILKEIMYQAILYKEENELTI